jgi:DNA-binding transcriptional LysR family regulator
MSAFTPEVLQQLRQAMVIFNIVKLRGAKKEIGWGSGFSCFPDPRAILTCSHNFVDASPEFVIARHVSSEMRCAVPQVVFSRELDCAIAILDEPICGAPLSWSPVDSENLQVVVPDYVRGPDRVMVALKKEPLGDGCLTGHRTNTVNKAVTWVGNGPRKDTRTFHVPGAHPGLSGSPILSPYGVVGQASDSLDPEAGLTLNSHLLLELRADAEKMYEEAKTLGYLK